jgi:hypothetical protein
MLLIIFVIFYLGLIEGGAAIPKICLTSAHETLYSLRSVVRDDTLREGQQPTSALVFVPRGKPISSLSASLSIALSPPAGDGVLFLNVSEVLNSSGVVIDIATLPEEADVLPGGTLTDRRLVELQKLVAEMSAMNALNEPGKRRVAVIIHDASELSADGINRLNLLNRLLDGRSLVTDVEFRASSRSSRKAFKSGELSVFVIVPWDKNEREDEDKVYGAIDLKSKETAVINGDEEEKNEEEEKKKENKDEKRQSITSLAVEYLTRKWMKSFEERAAIKGEKENRPLNLDALLGRLRSNVIVLSETLRIVDDIDGGGAEEEERKKAGCRRSDLKAAAEALLTDELSYKGRGGGGGRRNKGSKGRSSYSNSYFDKNSLSMLLTISAVLLSTLLIAVALYCMCCSAQSSVVGEELKNKQTKKGGEKNANEAAINTKELPATGLKKVVSREDRGDERIALSKKGFADMISSSTSSLTLGATKLEKNVLESSNNANLVVRRRTKSTSDKNRKSS